MAIEIRVPQIETNTSIGRWFKRVGDPVTANEPLVEIETDVGTLEVPAQITGVLSDILVPMADPLRQALYSATLQRISELRLRRAPASRSNGLGMKIIQALVKQIDGKLSIGSGNNGGRAHFADLAPLFCDSREQSELR